MALQVQTFPNFTPALYAAFCAKVKADTGVELTKPSGTVTHGSFVFTYAYDQVAQVFTMQCQKKPIFLPASTIIKGIVEEIAELRESEIVKPISDSTE